MVDELKKVTTRETKFEDLQEAVKNSGMPSGELTIHIDGSVTWKPSKNIGEK
jgi:hypothetical protein